jgi:hypothetical protein
MAGSSGWKKARIDFAPARRRSLPVKRSLRWHTGRCSANRRLYRFPERSAGSWLQEARQSSMASISSPSSPLTRFALGLAEAINHAFGNPREEGAHLPPLVVVRPYRDQPQRRSH